MADQTPVVIVGAGPTGLFAALVLSRLGVPLRIIDQSPAAVDTSRAMGVQARTLEFYRMLGIADEAIALGSVCDTVHIRRIGREMASFSLASMGEGASPYPFMLTLAQDVHERFLIGKLADGGVEVQRMTTLQHLTQDTHGVNLTLLHEEGTEELRASYVIGADGASSVVRKSLNTGFGGGTSTGLAYVADVELAEETGTDVFMGFGPDTLSLMLPVRTSGTKRFIGLVAPELADEVGLTFESVRPRAEKLLGLHATKVNWFSTYKVHHRVAEQFRVGRCFIAGDAGHIHSPVGGQGMNTGLGDAMNLSWKLAYVLNGRADPKILSTYHDERHAFAQELIKSTDTAFQRLTMQGSLGRFVRLQLAPRAFGFLTRIAAVRRTLFRTMSQTRIAYPDSALSSGTAGKISGGDRLPWVASAHSLDALSLDWGIVASGTLNSELTSAAKAFGIQTKELAWSNDLAQAGFEENAAYLMRPDGYVAIAGVTATSLKAYARSFELTFSDPAQDASAK